MDDAIKPYFYNYMCKLMDELLSEELPYGTVYDNTA